MTLTETKTYGYVIRPDDSICGGKGAYAYDKLEAITKDNDAWFQFAARDELSRFELLDLIDDLVRGIVFTFTPKEPDVPNAATLVDDLREEFEPKFENGQPF